MLLDYVTYDIFFIDTRVNHCGRDSDSSIRDLHSIGIQVENSIVLMKLVQ